MTALLQLKNVSRSFGGVRAIHNVSLTLEPGQIVGLIGPNGAGKSTLVNIITGVHPASSGEVLHKGEPIQRFKPFQISARGIARTFQVVQPFPAMTVVENVMAGAMFAAGIPSMDEARRVAVKGGFAAAKRREIDDATLARSDVHGIVSIQQAIQDEQADIYDPVNRGVIRWEQLIEIGEILAGNKEGRTKAEQITFYKNNAGQGVADVALGAAVLDKIKAKHSGLQLHLE